MLRSADSAVRSLGPTFTGSCGRMGSQRHLGPNEPEIIGLVVKERGEYVDTVGLRESRVNETQITRTEHIKKLNAILP